VCCRGWHISLSYAEYCRLLGLDCSLPLRRKLDAALKIYDKPENDRYAYLAEGSDGFCNLLDSDGLCSLQRECGAGALSSVCRMYPRAVHVGCAAETVCTNSCEAVLERLLSDTQPIEFKIVDREVKSTVPMGDQSEEQIGLRIRCIDEIQNPDKDIVSRVLSVGRMLLGDAPTLMMHDLGSYITAAYDLISGLSPCAPALAEQGGAALDVLGITSRDDIDCEACERFCVLQRKIKSDIPEIHVYFGKIFANHMYYEQFPYTSECRGLREAYIAFCATFVLVTFIAVCCYDGGRARDAFVDAVATVFRTVEHSAFYKNANIVLRADGDL